MWERFDQELIAEYLKGDEKSLELLICRYLKPIYSFVYRYLGNAGDAEDVTQEVFVKAWRNLKKFDQQRSFKTWIFSIAKNTCIDALKKKKAAPFSNFENEEGKNALAETLVDLAPLPDELFEQADITKKLGWAMEQLSPKYRVASSLRYNDRLTFREISEALGEPLHTIKSRCGRALARLKKLLTEL